MSQNDFLELKDFFLTDQEMFEEKRKDLLVQVQTETVMWEDETVALARQLCEDGFLDRNFKLTLRGKELLGI